MFRSALLLFALTCLLENSVLGRPSDDVKVQKFSLPSQSSALSEQEIGPSDEALLVPFNHEMQHHSNGEGLSSSNEEMYDRAPLPVINDANYTIGQGKDKQRTTGDVSRSTRGKREVKRTCNDNYCSQWGKNRAMSMGWRWKEMVQQLVQGGYEWRWIWLGVQMQLVVTQLIYNNKWNTLSPCAYATSYP